MNKSHLTAIGRKKISLPTKYLKDINLLWGKTLDYGCGRGFDAIYLNLDKYDPYYFPKKPEEKYNTIICNFVLNVIEDKNERIAVIKHIKSLLHKGGKAYITVRDDIQRLNGRTSKGTWQGHIVLDLPIMYIKKGAWAMYVIDN